MDQPKQLYDALDERYLVNTLVRLMKIPTDVPLGPETLIEPDHPKLVHYVQDVIRPELQEIGVYGIMDAPLNQLVVRMGEGTSDRALLIMVYTPTQHANLMKDPFSGKIAVPRQDPSKGPCVFGQGASQNKAHMAVMLCVLKLLVDTGIRLSGTLYFAVNNEGRSSHHCTEALLPLLDPRPGAAILAIGTGMRLSIGNRGRVDIYVHVKGKPTHSSDPASGLSAISGAYEVMKRLEGLKPNASHPLLGDQQLIPYQIVYDPVAPHTLPATAKLTLDRRLLPGEDIDAAVKAVEETLTDMAPYEVNVEKGVFMLPSLTEEDSDIVKHMKSASLKIMGEEAEHYYSKSTFDAGGCTSGGIPAVMFGASGGDPDILGEDYVAIGEVVQEAKMIAHTIQEMLA